MKRMAKIAARRMLRISVDQSSFSELSFFKQPPDEKRYDEIVGNHDGERDARHDDHRRCSRKPADEGSHGQQVVSV